MVTPIPLDDSSLFFFELNKKPHFGGFKPLKKYAQSSNWIISQWGENKDG